MTTEWYWLEQEQERGPVSFRDLALMVQEHVLDEDDLVRPHYSEEWQTADRVVGLFYMARRIPRERLQSGSIVDSTICFASPDDRTTAMSEAVFGDELKRWFHEQLAATPVSGTVGAVTESKANSESDNQPRTFPAAANDGIWQTMLSAALSRFDSRHGRKQTLRPRLSEAMPPAILRSIFRFGLSMVTMNAAIIAILSWSATESQRYPDRQALARQVRSFPGWGPSSPSEFTFLLVDAALIAAAIGYVGARALESMADD